LGVNLGILGLILWRIKRSARELWHDEDKQFKVLFAFVVVAVVLGALFVALGLGGFFKWASWKNFFSFVFCLTFV
jgi:hypothetical protein